MKKIKSFKLRNGLYFIENTDKISRVLSYISIVIALVTLSSVFYHLGFYTTEKIEKIIIGFIFVSFFFFFLKYFFLLFYAYNRKQYFRKHLVEGLFLLFFVVYSTLLFCLNKSAWEHYQTYYIFVFFVQLYFLMVSLLEWIHTNEFLSKIHISPPVLMIISFFIIINIRSMSSQHHFIINY